MEPGAVRHLLGGKSISDSTMVKENVNAVNTRGEIKKRMFVLRLMRHPSTFTALQH